MKPLNVYQKTKASSFRKQYCCELIYKCSYINAIEEILNDDSKFSKLDIPAGKWINCLINLEKRITSELKLLKNKKIIDKLTYKSIKPVGSTPCILYGLLKIHKETEMDYHLFALFFQLLVHLPTNWQRFYWSFIEHFQQLMNILSLIHFTLQKKFVNRIPTYIWLV